MKIVTYNCKHEDHDDFSDDHLSKVDDLAGSRKFVQTVIWEIGRACDELIC